MVVVVVGVAVVVAVAVVLVVVVVVVVLVVIVSSSSSSSSSRHDDVIPNCKNLLRIFSPQVSRWKHLRRFVRLLDGLIGFSNLNDIKFINSSRGIGE